MALGSCIVNASAMCANPFADGEVESEVVLLTRDFGIVWHKKSRIVVQWRYLLHSNHLLVHKSELLLHRQHECVSENFAGGLK